MIPENPTPEQVIELVCCGNKEAEKFLTGFQQFIHAIDDIIDEKEYRIIPITCILAKSIYSTQFYQHYQKELSLLIDLITNAYEDSEDFSKYGVNTWQSMVGDVIRCNGLEMMLAIANICGGYLHMRKISYKIREVVWKNQH